MNDAAQVQVKAVAILSRLAQEAKAWLEPLDLYPRLVALLHEEAGYQNCALLLSTGADKLTQVAALGYRSSQGQREYPLPHLCLGEGEVARDVFLINNVEATPAAKAGGSIGRGSVLVGLLGGSPHPSPQSEAEDKIVGAIVVEDERPDAFSAADCQLLQLIAPPLAMAVEVSQHYQKVREMALYDELTGLHNRRFFYEFLERELGRAGRTGEPVSLAIIDVDRLKRINDVHGHLSGDKVLHFVAQVLARNIRAYDVLARYGGDEFALVMPGTKPDEAEKVMNRLVAATEKARRDYQGQDIHVPSFSYGLASSPHDGKTYEEVFAAADKRLYQAKARKGIYTEGVGLAN